MKDNDESEFSGLVYGRPRIVNGLLCSIGRNGRIVLRAPRRGDVSLAARITAAIAHDPDLAKALAAGDVTSITEKP